MPYGSNLGNINPETWLPDIDRYPKAGQNQGTTLPEDFNPLKEIDYTPTRINNAIASWAQDIHTILKN